MKTSPSEIIRLLDHYCMKDDLSTHDPYDIWTWKPGFAIKKFYNRCHLLALPFAASFTLFDRMDTRHTFFPKREYPIVRAMASMILTSLYAKTRDERYKLQSEKHLEWLLAHTGKTKYGIGWGVLVPRTVTAKLCYSADMTYSTITPYCLEAFYFYSQTVQDSKYSWIFEKFLAYFLRDIQVMFEDENSMATSYSTLPDRIVLNSVSYSMYARSLLAKIFPDQKNPLKIEKLHHFIRNAQRQDGAWLYNYQDPHSFIDTFHSCFILKNLIKTSRLVQLEGIQQEISSGWRYLKDHAFDPEANLFKRFAVSNKPGIIQYDLYDNAEALNIACLLNDQNFAEKLQQSISSHFMKQDTIYSRIDLCGKLICPDYLRWAVMPYLLTLSNMLPDRI